LAEKQKGGSRGELNPRTPAGTIVRSEDCGLGFKKENLSLGVPGKRELIRPGRGHGHEKKGMHGKTCREGWPKPPGDGNEKKKSTVLLGGVGKNLASYPN